MILTHTRALWMGAFSMTKWILCFWLMLYAQVSLAFKFTPMSQTLNLDSDSSRVVFTIENDSDSSMAIELKLKTRQMKRDGSEDQNELGEDYALSLYPEQLIVPAAQKRSVRVSWESDKKPPHELAYRVIAEQLPVNLEGDEKPAGIKMLLRYVAALYVNPGKQKSDVVLKKSTLKNSSLVLHLDNKGGQHQILNDLVLVVENGEEKKDLKGSDIPGLKGENILAKTARIFKLPLKGPLSNLKEGFKIKLDWDN